MTHSAHGNVILSAVNKAKSSSQINSAFPHLTNTQQTQECNIQHAIPNNSDLHGQSESDSCDLEPPSKWNRNWRNLMMMKNLSHFLNGRHQTTCQAVTHQALTQDQRAVLPLCTFVPFSFNLAHTLCTCLKFCHHSRNIIPSPPPPPISRPRDDRSPQPWGELSPSDPPPNSRPTTYRCILCRIHGQSVACCWSPNDLGYTLTCIDADGAMQTCK